MPSTTLFNRLTMPDGRRGWCMWFAMAALLAFGPGSSAADAAGSGFKVLHVFGPAEARSATGDLVEGRGKRLYGTSWYGGAADSGTVFEITTDGVMNVTYPFGPKQRDPHEPVTGLTLANDGNFYGTTADGGSALFGTVFRLAPGKEPRTIHEFVGGEGIRPTGRLLQGSDGNLYGVTVNSGLGGQPGAIFRVTLDGQLTVLHNFLYAPEEPHRPYGGLIQAQDGNYYGTTLFGGPGRGGTIYRMTPSSAVTVVHGFDENGADGCAPYAQLLEADDGLLYGTTSACGDHALGTAFRVTLAGALEVLHQFKGGANDGREPRAPLIQASNGDFYGTTCFGGAHNDGTLYRLRANGEFTVLHSFDTTDGNGWCPAGALLQASDGRLYGTTSVDGTLFRIRAR